MKKIILFLLLLPTLLSAQQVTYKAAGKQVRYSSSARELHLPVTITAPVPGDAFITAVKQNNGSVDAYFLADGTGRTIEHSVDGGSTWVPHSAFTSPYHLVVSNNVPVRLRISKQSAPTAYQLYKYFALAGATTGKASVVDYGDSNRKDCNGACTDSTVSKNLDWILAPANYNLPVLNKGQGGEDAIGRYYYIYNNYDNTNNYNTAVSTTIAEVAYETNDIGTYGRSWQSCLADLRRLDSTLAHAGHVVVINTAAIAYGVDAGYGEINAIVKAHPDTVFATGVVSFYDNDTLNSQTSMPEYRDYLHYKPKATAIQARLIKPVLDSIAALTRVIPAQAASLSWNAGTQNVTIVPGAGYIATDYEFSLNWDAVSGMTSMWYPCLSTSIPVTSTVPSNGFAVRVRYTPLNPPGPVITNSTQFN